MLLVRMVTIVTQEFAEHETVKHLATVDPC